MTPRSRIACLAIPALPLQAVLRAEPQLLGSALRELHLQLSARLVEQCRDVLSAELVERLAHLHQLHEIVGSQLIAEGVLDRDVGVGRGAPRHHRTDRKTFAGTQGQG